MPEFDAKKLTALGRVGALAVSPCGSWVAVEVARLDPDDAKYVTDLWRVPVDGGPPARLTRGEHSDRGPRFRGDGALLFLSDRLAGAKDEKRTQVWALPAHGEPQRLTDEPLGVSEFRVAADTLVVLANRLPGVAEADQRTTADDRAKHGPSGIKYTQMPVRHWDHWVGDAAPHVVQVTFDGGQATSKDLTPSADREYREAQWDLSPDGRWVAITHARMESDRISTFGLELIDLHTGQRHTAGDEPRVDYSEIVFHGGSRQLACARHQRRDGALGRVELWVIDLDGKGAPLASGWDCVPHPQAWAGDDVLVVADEAGLCPVFRVNPTSHAVERLTDPAAGGAHQNVRALPDGRVVGVRSTLLHPPEVFVCATQVGAHPEVLTQLSGFSGGDDIALVSSFTVPGDGGDPVQSFFVRPKHVVGAAPTFLWVHGGPIGQHTDVWHWRWNALVAVAAGYNVVLPNPRGSTGFGQAFIEGIWNNTWGAACFHDLMAVTDALEARDEVDPARIIGMGGSFGGYMTNWFGGQTDRFCCLVTHAGLYNMSAFHGSTDGPGWFAMELEGTPDVDRDAFDRYSPERFLQQWTTPTLIIHGEKDYRVPIGEALALFEGLQRRGVESEFLAFADENHWILRPRNIRQWYDTFLAFAARYV